MGFWTRVRLPSIPFFIVVSWRSRTRWVQTPVYSIFYCSKLAESNPLGSDSRLFHLSADAYRIVHMRFLWTKNSSL